MLKIQLNPALIQFDFCEDRSQIEDSDRKEQLINTLRGKLEQ